MFPNTATGASLLLERHAAQAYVPTAKCLKNYNQRCICASQPEAPGDQPEVLEDTRIPALLKQSPILTHLWKHLLAIVQPDSVSSLKRT